MEFIEIIIERECVYVCVREKETKWGTLYLLETSDVVPSIIVFSVKEGEGRKGVNFDIL